MYIPLPVRRLLRILLLAYLGASVMLALFQSRFIYFPRRGSESELTREAAENQLQPWRDAQGTLIGWKSASRNPAPANRLVVFNGNAGSAVDRSHFVDCLVPVNSGKLWEVYLFEYPGYGARNGEPGEPAFQQAAESALKSLQAAGNRPIYLLGESIGGGVACYLAGRFPNEISGLFLVTPFTQLADVAAYHYPVVPVRVLLKDRYDNVRALANYKGPLAMLLAGKDKVIPAKFGQALYDQHTGPKRLWIQEEGDHNTLDYTPGDPVWREISDFLLKR